MRFARILVVGWLMLATHAFAVEEVELVNPEDEKRFMELANELRCMVCQNQSIADSNAELARDFRNQVKEKMNAGQSNKEIRQYMTERYGDYILYRPPFNLATAALWTGPFVLIVVGIFIIMRIVRRPAREQAGDASADEANRARLKSMLRDEGESS